MAGSIEQLKIDSFRQMQPEEIEATKKKHEELKISINQLELLESIGLF